jgi:hypothetical protein
MENKSRKEQKAREDWMNHQMASIGSLPPQKKKKLYVAITTDGVWPGLDEDACLIAQLEGILGILQSSTVDIDIDIEPCLNH